MRIPHYTKVYQLGHKWIQNLLNGPIIVEEKIDGSQFSFRIKYGQLECCSKNCDKRMTESNDMFFVAVQRVMDLFVLDKLQEEYIYRGEFLSKPHHNVLKYNRIPAKNIIIFDIDCGVENYVTPNSKQVWADEMGLEIVPLLWEGDGKDLTVDLCRELLNRESILGGTQIEGIVIKNYNQFGPDGKILAGKFVSEKFKEEHKTAWQNPDIITEIIQRFGTQMRWQKAIQHLKESGELRTDVVDIGPLIKEIQNDIKTECQDQIKEMLFNHSWKQISNKIIRGFPDWYKQILLEKQFETNTKLS